MARASFAPLAFVLAATIFAGLLLGTTAARSMEGVGAKAWNRPLCIPGHSSADQAQTFVSPQDLVGASEDVLQARMPSAIAADVFRQMVDPEEEMLAAYVTDSSWIVEDLEDAYFIQVEGMICRSLSSLELVESVRLDFGPGPDLVGLPAERGAWGVELRIVAKLTSGRSRLVSALLRPEYSRLHFRGFRGEGGSFMKDEESAEKAEYCISIHFGRLLVQMFLIHNSTWLSMWPSRRFVQVPTPPVAVAPLAAI